MPLKPLFEFLKREMRDRNSPISAAHHVHIPPGQSEIRQIQVMFPPKAKDREIRRALEHLKSQLMENGDLRRMFRPETLAGIAITERFHTGAHSDHKTSLEILLKRDNSEQRH